MAEQKSPFARKQGQSQSDQRSPFARNSKPAAAPARRGTKRDATTEVAQFLNEVNRNIPGASELQAWLEVGKRAFQEAGEGRGGYGLLTTGNMGKPFTPARQSFAEARARQRNMSQDLNTRRPLAAAFTRGTAQAAPILIPGAQATPLPAAGRALTMARVATANVAAGAANRAALGEGSAGERLQRAADPSAIVKDAALGAALGRLAPALPTRAKRVRPEVQVLAREGVQMTPGQVLGGLPQRLEDAATSAPIVGPAISAARQRGIESYNRVAAQRALRPIGQELPDATKPGSDAIASAAEQISKRYEEIVPNEGMVINDPAVVQQLSDLSNITAEMTDEASSTLSKIINQRLVKRVSDGRLTGEAFKRVEAELGEIAGRYTKSPDIAEQDVGRALNFVLETLRENLGRQNPAYARALADTNKAYSRLATLETAAGRAGAVDGIVTPKQLREAYRFGDKSVRRRATAQGRRPDQAFYDAGATVLPSQLPDSGTATRGMNNPLALGGMGALAATNPSVGVPAVGGLLASAGAYSTPVMNLFNRVLQSNISKRDREIALEQLGQLAVQNPQIKALYDQALSRLGYATQPTSQPSEMVVPQF